MSVLAGVSMAGVARQARTIVRKMHGYDKPDWVLISSVQEVAEFIPRRKPLAPTIRLEP